MFTGLYPRNATRYQRSFKDFRSHWSNNEPQQVVYKSHQLLRRSWKESAFYKIQNGGKSNEAELKVIMLIFVEQVQADIYGVF